MAWTWTRRYATARQGLRAIRGSPEGVRRTTGRSLRAGCEGGPAPPGGAPTPFNFRAHTCCLLHLDLDLPRAGALGLRQGDRQDAGVVLRLDLVGIYQVRQREATLEGAIGPLVAVHPLGLLLSDLPLLAPDRQHLILDRDLHVLGLHAWDLAHDLDAVLVLEHVTRGAPRGRERSVLLRLPRPVSERLIQQAVEPAQILERIEGVPSGHDVHVQFFHTTGLQRFVDRH